MVTDIIDREIVEGDYVVFFNNVYIVKKIPVKVRNNGAAAVKIMLANPSATTRPIVKFSKDMCLLNKDDVLLWLLKRKH